MTANKAIKTDSKTEALVALMKECGGDAEKAAKKLGIGKDALRARLTRAGYSLSFFAHSSAEETVKAALTPIPVLEAMLTKKNEAIAKFPAFFGLKRFPNDTFRISVSSSYVGDNGEVLLYTERLVAEDGKSAASLGTPGMQRWASFAKGTVAELMGQVSEVPQASKDAITNAMKAGVADATKVMARATVTPAAAATATPAAAPAQPAKPAKAPKAPKDASAARMVSDPKIKVGDTLLAGPCIWRDGGASGPAGVAETHPLAIFQQYAEEQGFKATATPSGLRVLNADGSRTVILLTATKNELAIVCERCPIDLCKAEAGDAVEGELGFCWPGRKAGCGVFRKVTKVTKSMVKAVMKLSTKAAPRGAKKDGAK